MQKVRDYFNHAKIINGYIQLLVFILVLFFLSPVRFWSEIPFPDQAEAIVVIFCLIVVVFLLFSIKSLGETSCRVLKLKLSKIDLAAFCLAVYISIRYLFQSRELSVDYIAQSIVLLISFLIFRKIQPPYVLLFIGIIPVTGLFQILYGIKKQALFFMPGYGLKDVSGIFLNTGIFGGYIAVASVVALALIVFSRKNKELFQGALPFKLSGLIFFGAFVILLIQMLYSNSRSAWIAFAVGSFSLVCSQVSIRPFIRKLSGFYRAGIAGILLCSVVIMSLGLYKYKKDSADGRILIWTNAFAMIRDKPVFGHGINGFQASYMEYQAKWFQCHPESKYARLADDNQFAFNEFIRVWVELGTVGFMLVLSLCYHLLFSTKPGLREHAINRNKAVARSALVALLVFACFSYPMEVFQFKLLAVFFVAVLSRLSSNQGNIVFDKVVMLPGQGARPHYVLRFMFFSMVLLSGYWSVCFLGGYYRSCRNWEEGMKTFSKADGGESTKKLDVAYLFFKENGRFLTIYGQALNESGQYERAIPVLLQANKYLSLSANYIELGKGYQATGNFDKAIKAWEKASFMVPSRFAPHYLMAKMLFDNGRIPEARQIARELLDKDVKIWTPALQNMKDELTEMVRNTHETQ